MPYCPNCGKEVPTDARFCVNCGKSLEIAAAVAGTPVRKASQQLAGLRSRLVAGIIDYIIIGIVAAVIVFALFAPWFMVGPIRGGMMPFPFWGWFGGMFGIQFLLWLVYFTYFEGTSGQTPGKKFGHIKVLKSDGTSCDFGAALVRNLLRIIDSLPFIYILGIILIAATDKHQRLGDMLAKTIVVKV